MPGGGFSRPTGAMSLDQHGVLYAAFDDFAIYRLFPWSDTFELFAGRPGVSSGEEIMDGLRVSASSATTTASLGQKSKKLLAKFGAITHMDALGHPGFIWILDGGSGKVRRIEKKEGGRVVRTQTKKDTHRKG